MVAPVLAALGMYLLGQGTSAVAGSMKRTNDQADRERTAALYRQAMGGAMGGGGLPDIGMDPGQRGLPGLGGEFPQAGQSPAPDSGGMMGAALRALQDPLTAETGRSMLSAATQMRGQNQTAETARAQLSAQMEQRVAEAEQRAAVNARELEATQRSITDNRSAAVKGLRNDLDPVVQPLVTAGNMLRAGAKAPPGYAGDQQVIFGVARLLDPLGPLNDSTVKSVQGNPSLPSTTSRLFGKYLEGETLNPGDREDLLQMAATLYQAQKQGALAMADPILKTAARSKLPVDEIFNPAALLGDQEVAGLLAGRGKPRPQDEPAPGAGAQLDAINAGLGRRGLPAIKPGETQAEYHARIK